MNALIAAALSQALVPTVHLPPSSADPCARFEASDDETGEDRTMKIDDLVEIADIGRSDPSETASPFGISPDGTQIAFIVRRANAETNSYCQRLLVAPMGGQGAPHELDRGGTFIRADFALRDHPVVTSGWAKVITPRWSPDGSALAFLKRMAGQTQVWIVSANGETDARRVTAMPDDVDDFSWSKDGRSLVVTTRPDIRRQAERIAREARDGFLFDERFSPQMADRPIPRERPTREFTVVDIDTGERRPATREESADLVPASVQNAAATARSYVAGPAGYSAWLEATDADQLISPARLVMSNGQNNRLECDDPCRGMRQLGWMHQEGALFGVRRTGWAQAETAVIRWDIGKAEPTEVLRTDDVLIGCHPAGRELVCAREGSTRPRRLVALDMQSGTERVIHDPNPDFAAIRLGEVERLRFRNSYGVESFADLVLPPDHVPGQRHPLVVVQYHSHGFLRGGTGDEFPIQLLAARGFAVLSFARPDFVSQALRAKTEAELRRANRVGWIDRRRVQSSLEKAVALAVERGVVDQKRMGISGFSDGSSTVQWALISSRLFKVAALGSCCEDLYSYPLAAGPSFADFGREMGYRFFEPDMKEFWKPMSMLLNVERIDVPILIQTGDSEYEAGLDVFELFSLRNKPIELYVFENEPHIKWQPAHRRAIYRRSIEWFAFWLKGTMDCSPDRKAQFNRWRAMPGAPPAPRCAPPSRAP